jgi:hypothetical protein
LIQKCVRAAKEDYLDDIREMTYGALIAMGDPMAGLVEQVVTKPAHTETGAVDEQAQWEGECLARLTRLVEDRIGSFQESPYALGY